MRFRSAARRYAQRPAQREAECWSPLKKTAFFRYNAEKAELRTLAGGAVFPAPADRCAEVFGKAGAAWTVTETAERWGVSQRLVQKLCTEGRIQGAQKFSGAWAIPTDAAKPEDLRRTRHREGDRAAAVETVPRPPVQTAGKNLMPLMNTPFVPGQCLAAVEAMEEGPQRDIALAEYHYFSGHPEEAAGEAER